MMIRISKVLSISSFFIAAATLFTACVDEKTDCEAEIICVDLATGAPIQGATVKVTLPASAPVDSKGFYYCGESEATLERILTTDASGRVEFCLKYPGSPTIIATSGSLSATTVISVSDPKTTASVTVKLK
ncbi:MAG: hypothetical protein ACKOXB_00475 [Flavobacteriales bacterium]